MVFCRKIPALIFAGWLALDSGIATTIASQLSQKDGDRLQRKIDAIHENGSANRPVPRKTPVTENEVNSYLAFNIKEKIPNGLTNPEVTILGADRLAGRVFVDIDDFKRNRNSTGVLDPLNYLSGKVPVTARGFLQTNEGRGRFYLESAEILRVPLPKPLLQELATFFSRSPERPNGIDIDAPFDLPAKIRKIETERGEAVIMQ
jgi:hypothetical protein